MKKIIIAGVCVAMGMTAHADVASLTSSSDTYMRANYSYAANGVSDNMDFRYDFTAYFQFDMSSLGNVSVNSATLSLHKLANARNDSMTSGRVGAYALGGDVGNTEQDWNETDGGWQSRVPAEDHGLDFRNMGNDWLSGTGAVAANLVNLDLESGATVTESVIDSGATYTLSGADVVGLLNLRLSDDGMVTFIMENTDTGGRGWGWATKENAESSLHPTLTIDYTVIPEPATLGLMGVFGSAVLIVRRRFMI